MTASVPRIAAIAVLGLTTLLGVLGRDLHWGEAALGQENHRITAKNGSCSAQVSTKIESILNQPIFRRTRWGISIQTLPSPQGTPASPPLFDHQGEQFFIPASAAKVFTTAAALVKLGPDFRFKTPFLGSAQSGNRLQTLRVIGQADPSLTTESLEAIAQTLKQKGITQIDTLIGVDPLGPATLIPSWEWEDVLSTDGVPMNGLILDENVASFELAPQQMGMPLRLTPKLPLSSQTPRLQNQTRTVGPGAPEFLEVHRSLDGQIVKIIGQLQAGSSPDEVFIAIADPSQHFLVRLRGILASQGIAVQRLVLNPQNSTERNPQPNPSELVLAEAVSDPLSVLIKAVNTESNNFYAEALLLRLARSTAETASGTTHATPTYEQGLTTLRQILAQKQVDPSSYALADGSGLSRQNLVSPQSLVSVLVAMSQDPNAAVFRQSLAIAGESGTLSSRFNNTAVAGNLVGKTGTLKHTVTLAGYLTPPNYSPLGLSLMVNQSDQPLPQVRQAMDQIIQELMTLQPCQER